LRQAIKERLQLTLTLQNQRKSFQNLLDKIPNIIARFDASLRHVYVNPAVETITGIPAAEFLNKTNAELGMPPDLVHLWENEILEVFTSGQPGSMEFVYSSNPQAPAQMFQSYLVPEYAEQGDAAPTVEYVLAITRDITAEKQMELQLRLAAEQDGLTQLANRRTFDRTLDEYWQEALQTHRPIALILCDVDFFKAYNDCHGHVAGDTCLQQIAQTLQQTVTRSHLRSQGVVARYGGEEFGIILPATPLSSALDLAQAVRQAINHNPIPHHGSPLTDHITLSLGCTSGIPTEALSPADFIRMADRCLYQAKQQGRDRVVGDGFTPDQ
ncbi:MAG: sensor domain-containing diguanylate cyclase, partial [Prochlorothrix sp.]